MQFYIMTLFPEMVMQGLSTSIIGRAVNKGLLSIEAVNIRDYAFNKHNSCLLYTSGRKALRFGTVLSGSYGFPYSWHGRCADID